jgi:threonine aldolase
MTIDLRSDTVTRPSDEMRQAIATAVVGDDVFGDDPTLIELESRVAKLLRQEAALFVPSGCMANQLAVRSQTTPGDQVIVEEGCHVYRYEAGGSAVLSGVQLTTISTQDGVLGWPSIAAAINPDDIHCAPPKLICVENTHNRHGGVVFPIEALRSVSEEARSVGLSLHLDGARLWNASVATGIAVGAWAELVDSVSVCFSKGLGAPVGSVLAGNTELIRRARRGRKLLGGGMRQAGILAAACLYALDHNIERLAFDHANAKLLAANVRNPGLRLLRTPETNIVIFDLPSTHTASDVRERLAEQGLWLSAMGPHRLRLVTHLDATSEDCETATAILNELDLS